MFIKDGNYLKMMKGKYMFTMKGTYLFIMKGKHLFRKKRASQARNADPPRPGQNIHEMGRHKSFRDILGGKLHRIPARSDLDRSRPL